MAKLTQLQELDAAIKIAARDADPTVPSFEIAGEFYKDYRKLIFEQVAEQWLVEKLASLIRKHRAKARRENDPQLVIEGMLGFTHLPRTLEVKPGKRVPRAEATAGPFRRLVKSLRKAESPALAEGLEAIELFKRHTPERGGRRITWGEVTAMEAEAKKAKAAK